jgi:RNA polymerase sigma-70 factor (ECF subfamily)
VSRDGPDATLSREGASSRPALSELFHAHADFVWRALRRLGLSPPDAEDGVQEVFLVVNRRLRTYEEKGAMRAWLFVICRQIARQEYRRRKTRAALDETASAPSPADDPAEITARREAASVVRQFLDTLDEPQALVFYLSEIEGLSAPEVAAAMDAPVNTIYGRLRLARERFEALLERRAAHERRPWNR